jgi:hypothetical protein
MNVRKQLAPTSEILVSDLGRKMHVEEARSHPP